MPAKLFIAFCATVAATAVSTSVVDTVGKLPLCSSLYGPACFPVNGMDVPFPMPFSSKSDRKVKEAMKTVDPDMLELSQAFAVMSELMASKKPTDTLTEEEEAQFREKVEVVRSQLAAMGFELQLGGEVTDFHGPEGSVPTFALKKMEDGTDDDDRSEPKTTAKRKSASKS